MVINMSYCLKAVRKRGEILDFSFILGNSISNWEGGKVVKEGISGGRKGRGSEWEGEAG